MFVHFRLFSIIYEYPNVATLLLYLNYLTYKTKTPLVIRRVTNMTSSIQVKHIDIAY